MRRAAWFLWIMPLVEALPKARTATGSSACAVGASLRATAEVTRRMVVRRAERSLVLRSLRFLFWRLRFSAEG